MTEQEALPQPKLYEMDGKLFLMMEHKGRQASIRIPRQFLKCNDEQRKWFLANLRAVPRLFKKLGIKYP